MSLCCIETGRIIMFGEPLYGVCRTGTQVLSAVAREVIKQIPKTARFAIPRKREGVNVYWAIAGRHFNGAYMWSNFQRECFLFSISLEVAEQYLPKYLSTCRIPARLREVRIEVTIENVGGGH